MGRSTAGTSASTPDKQAPTASTANTADAEFSGGGVNVAYSKARAIREQYEARLARLKYEQLAGTLVNRDEIQVSEFNTYRTYRDLMLSIPERLAAQLAAETNSAKVHEILLTDIRKALNDFADANS